MQNKEKQAIPITYEQILQRAGSKLTPYFEIRGETGNLLVCANHEKSPACNYKTSDIAEAIAEISNEGAVQYIFIKFMSAPAERTNAQSYVYLMNTEFNGEITPYWLFNQKEQTQGQGLGGYNQQAFNPHLFAKEQQFLGKQESWIKEVMLLGQQQQLQHQQAMGSAMEAKVQNTMNAQILEMQRQNLEERYKDKEELLQQKFEMKEEKLKGDFETMKREIDAEWERIRRITRKIKAKIDEIKEADQKNKTYWLETGKGLMQALPELAGFAGFNLKKEKSLNGTETSQEPKSQEQAQREAQQEAKKKAGATSFRARRKEAQEQQSEEEAETQTQENE